MMRQKILRNWQVVIVRFMRFIKMDSMVHRLLEMYPLICE